MANITPIKTIDELNIFTRTGMVIDVQKGVRINTTTTTSGGGGYVHPNSGGYVSAPSTTTTHKSDDVVTLFIREDDGGEFTPEFTNSDVAVRRGNRVSVVHAGNKNANWGYYAALVNHDTGRNEIRPATAEHLVTRPGCSVVVLLAVLALVAAPVVAFVAGWGLSLVLPRLSAEGYLKLVGFLMLLAVPINLFILIRPQLKRGAAANSLKAAILQRVREEVQRLA